MKNYPFLLLVAFAMPLHAQLSDNFTDGEITSNPLWSGTADAFVVTSEQQLQSAGKGPGTVWISTPCTLTTFSGMHWQTSVRQSFASSASNFGRVYLVSDHPDLTQPLHGYYLQFGEAGSSDAIELFRQDGTARIPVCRGRDGAIASSFSVRVNVSCYGGLWNIETDYTGGNDFTPEASGFDSTYTSSSFFGMCCTYTASNASKFYYDDITVGELPPEPDPAFPKDIIVTEIFSDPDPSVGLPAAEYAELFSRSNAPVNLHNWKISDGSTSATFPGVKILPGEYAVVTAAKDAGLFTASPHVIGVEKFPSLNNDGDPVILKSPDNKTIDSVQYASSWFRDADKQNGGWSLELIDPGNPCGEEDNWTASENTAGGTPGFQNSVFAVKPDITGPRLLQCTPVTPVQINLRFDEKLAASTCSDARFVLHPDRQIGTIRFSDFSLREIVLDLLEELDTGTRYTLSVKDLTDCNRNVVDAAADHVAFALPEKADSLDIVINEILFNPRPLSVDFAEVYNGSDKFISLKGAALSNYSNGQVENGVVITRDDLTLAPKSFLCFTSDTAVLKINYPKGQTPHFFQCRLPGLSDDEGSLALSTAEGKVLDAFTYSKNFHSPLVQDDEGVSLERIVYSAPTNAPQNWTSASAKSGFATPGYVNSGTREGQLLTAETVAVDPVVFAPGAGVVDFATIRYRFDQGGYVANLKIVDSQSRLIKTIARNETLGAEGLFHWNGEREDGTLTRMGYYVVWLEVFTLSGTVRTFRKRVVVAGR